ncbi:MAG: oxygenase MpaB family protein [Vicinamibacteraceae bacterium]
MERPMRGGITWTIAGERIALLAWPRAILLQVAHPLIAAGVAQHSSFRSSPLAPFTRLHATVGAMRQLTFGTDDEAAAVVRRILAVHDRVNGALHEGTGPHPRGTRYSAHDPALLLWVHATLLDSHVRILEPIIGPFTPDQRDAYCREAAPFAVVLGAAADAVPRTWQQLQDFIAGQIEGGPVTVGADARTLAAAILHPPFARLAWPLRLGGELVTVGSLPPAIREGYGFAWNPTRERRRERVVAALRTLRGVAPAILARWPEARHAAADRSSIP